MFNPRPKSIYVHLDQLLFDLKYDPSIIEIPVPKYFKEEDKIKVEMAFKEKVERDTGKKKKKKPKKKKKGKKKKEEPEPEDEFFTMRGEQLEITIQNLREKLSNSKMQRNTLQIEKDMIHDFYQNTREEIKELESEIKNFDTKMQDEESRHNTLVVSHLQKVQHHEYEHGEAIEQTKADGAEIMNEEDKHHSEQESQNRNGKQSKKEDYERTDQANISEIEQETKQHQQNLDSLEQTLEQNKKTLISLYEQKQVDL